MSGEPGAFYGPDLAEVHERGYGDLAAAAAGLLLERLRAAGAARGTVVDLGCGPGLLARAAADAGFDVVGIDISPAMLSLARRRVPEGRFVEGSATAAEIPPCRAVAAVGEVLGYAADPRAGPAALREVIARAHAALEPGGLLLFDLLAPSGPPRSGRGRREGPGWSMSVEREEDRAAGTLTRRIAVVRRLPDGGERRTEEVHRVRLHHPARVLGDLRATGFRARPLRRYGDLTLAPGHVGYLARRVRR